jgi:hypothetical protein
MCYASDCCASLLPLFNSKKQEALRLPLIGVSAYLSNIPS